MTEKFPGRVGFLDSWRALAILTMFVWHFLWDLSRVGVLPESFVQSGFMQLVRYGIGVSFITVSGICARLSHRPLRRGLIVCAAAALVSLVTYLADAPVRFGVLHLLGVCMLLYAAVRREWEKLPAAAASGVALAVFLLTFYLPLRVRVSVPYLYPLGLRTADFFSADYYPLLPWGALFFAAAAGAGRLCDVPRETLVRPAPKAFTWMSRRSLLLYLLHQPILLGIAELWSGASRP